MASTNTRQTFEAVFRNVIVPKITAEFESTGLVKSGSVWLQNVRPHGLAFVHTLR
jgi:hypothetical protein